MRYLGTCPYGVASRSCCATQASVGDRVTPTWITFRDSNSMMKKANSERKKREVDLQEIAGPNLSSMITQECRPILSSRSRDAHLPHVFLDSSLTHANTQLEQLTADAFG